MLVQPASAWWGSSNQEDDDEDGADMQRFSVTNEAGGNEAKYGAQIFGTESKKDDFDSTQKRISAMNVLLPISNCAECRKVSYELSASNGCYTW